MAKVITNIRIAKITWWIKMGMDDKKELLYTNTNWFGEIIGNLEREIVLANISGNTNGAFEGVKQLFAHVSAHLKSKPKDCKDGDINKYFKDKFKEIEKLLYDPKNKVAFGTHAKVSANNRINQANSNLYDIYLELKKLMKESNLEALYGMSKDTMALQRRDSNVNKIFGRDK